MNNRLATCYAQALMQIFRKNNDTSHEALLNHFFSVLAAKGHRTLLPTIQKEYLRLLDEKEKSQVGRLTLASTESKKQASEYVEQKYDITFSGDTKVVVNDQIIGGFIYERGATRIDGSYKTFLHTLYLSLSA